MNRSPARVIELCVYALIIIAAVVWTVSDGRLYDPPDIPPPNIPQTAAPTVTPPVVPKGEVFPGE